MNANEGVCVRLNVIHTTSNWALQRGAKLGLAASQTKTTWKNVRHYMFL